MRRIAGIKLRRQAIQRTVKETEEPFYTWGIKGLRLGRNCGNLSKSWIRQEAEARLRVLEGLR